MIEAFSSISVAEVVLIIDVISVFISVDTTVVELTVAIVAGGDVILHDVMSTCGVGDIILCP